MPGEGYHHKYLFYPNSIFHVDDRHPRPDIPFDTETRKLSYTPHVTLPSPILEIEETAYWNWFDRKLYADIHDYACKGPAEMKRSCMSNAEVDPVKQCAPYIAAESHCFEMLFCFRESQIYDQCIGNGGKKLNEICKPVRQALDACMIRMQARLRAYTQDPIAEPPLRPWWLGAEDNPYDTEEDEEDGEVLTEPVEMPRNEPGSELPYEQGIYRYWKLRSRLREWDDTRFKDPWTEDWIPSGPTHTPRPMSDEDYLQHEVRLRQGFNSAVHRLFSAPDHDLVSQRRMTPRASLSHRPVLRKRDAKLITDD